MAEIGTPLLSAVLRYLAPYPGPNPLLCDPNSTSWVFDTKLYKYNQIIIHLHVHPKKI